MKSLAFLLLSALNAAPTHKTPTDLTSNAINRLLTTKIACSEIGTVSDIDKCLSGYGIDFTATKIDQIRLEKAPNFHVTSNKEVRFFVNKKFGPEFIQSHSLFSPSNSRDLKYPVSKWSSPNEQTLETLHVQHLVTRDWAIRTSYFLVFGMLISAGVVSIVFYDTNGHNPAQLGLGTFLIFVSGFIGGMGVVEFDIESRTRLQEILMPRLSENNAQPQV